MWNDLRFALRTLRLSPGFTLVAVLSLALGIGANTAIFSLLYQVVFRSLPVADPDSLVSLQSDGSNFGWTHADNSRTVFSYPMYVALRDHNQVFSGLIGRTSAPATLQWGGEASRVTAELVTGDFFHLLGVRPALGRLLTPEDEARQHPVIVLTHHYWANRLASDPKVLNRRVLMNGHPVVVVGVAARGFRSLISGQSPEFFVPASLLPMIAPAWRSIEQVDSFWISLFGRLKPGVSAAQAGAALQPLYHAVLEDHLQRAADVTERTRRETLARRLRVEPAAQGINVLRDEWKSPLVVLFAMVALVLLIACANVASLLVVRAAARQREIAVRFALGASRWQVGRQLLAESMTLTLAGGVLGWLLCGVLTHALLRLLPEDSTGNWLHASMDWRVLLFSIALAAATGVVFGLFPALRALRGELAPAMKQQDSGLTSGDSHAVGRRAFAAAQICFSLLLLVGAGLFTRSLIHLMSTDPGFRVDRLVTFSFTPALSGYSRLQALALGRELELRLGALPGVNAVTRAILQPFSSSGIGNGVKAPGTRAAGERYAECGENAVGANYFRTLGIPLLAGREFDAHDTEHSPKVAVLNETFARFLFEDQNPLGRRIHLGSNDSDVEIVGVIKDFRHGNIRGKPERVLYVPYEQADPEITRQGAFFIRTRSDERALMPAVRAAARTIAADVPIERMTTVNALLDRSIYKERLLASLAIAFGALAALLAAVGLYGTIAYSAARRRREFGIRLALGAAPASVLSLVLREAAALTAAGIAAGFALSYALANLVRSQLYGVSEHDPWTLIGATLLIACIALCAALSPSLRAMRVNPVEALRHE